MGSLLKLPSLFNCNDIRKLRQLYDTIEVHIRGLRSLDVSSETYGTLLLPVLLSKIPEEIRLIIGRKVKDDRWDLATLITNLKEEIDAREKCTLVKASAEHAPKKQNYTSYNKQPSSASASYLSNNRGPSCSFCGDKHASQDCFNVTSIQAGKEILRKAGRCFMCLRKNHLARECNSKGKCFRCSQKHHISLCNLYEKKTFPTVVKNLKSLWLKTVRSQLQEHKLQNCHWSLCKSSQIYPFANSSLHSVKHKFCKYWYQITHHI